jgi:hypothetical protein
MVWRYGQGEPLPPDFGYQGQWLADSVFLYSLDDTQAINGTAPRFTAVAQASDGTICLGFSVDQLASILGVTPDEVLVANRGGTLESFTSDIPRRTPTGARAKRYVFRLGDKKAALTVEVDEGTASD